MAQHDDAFGHAERDRVHDVFHVVEGAIGFLLFAANHDVDFGRHARSRVPGADEDPAHFGFRVAYAAEGARAARSFHPGRQLSQGGLRNRPNAGPHGGVLAALDAHGTKLSHHGVIGRHGVHVVVIAPDDHTVLQRIFGLEFVERVFGQVAGVVAVVPEGVLVGDYHVQAGLVGALQHAEGGHHRGRDAFDGGVRIAEHEGVASGTVVPRYPLVLPDELDDFAGGHAAGLQ